MRIFGLFALGLAVLVTAVGAKPLTILVSIDGCRWDYPELHYATFLQELAAAGTRVERLVPSYPTKTFPNHYTLVTGLRPAEHGIIQNKFYDPNFQAWFGIGSHPAAREGRWWGGEPIWNTLARQGKNATCMFWPGAEAAINGRHPDEWMPYQHDLPAADRIDQVVTWATSPSPPDLITLYFSVVDDAGHDFGPTAPETRAALQEVDAALRDLSERLRAADRWADTTMIVVADHGMTPVTAERIVLLEDLVAPGVAIADFSGACTALRLADPSQARALVDQINATGHPIRAYLRDEVPERLHFRDNARIPDIVIIPELGWRVFPRREAEKRINEGWADGGDHGFDPIAPDMSAIFIIAGRDIPAGRTLPPTDNVHVYHLLCALTGVKPAPNSGDGRLAWALGLD